MVTATVSFPRMRGFFLPSPGLNSPPAAQMQLVELILLPRPDTMGAMSVMSPHPNGN